MQNETGKRTNKENDYPDITRIEEKDFHEITDVWEASVRATHHFLKEEDILFFKPKIAGYLAQTESFCIRNEEGRIVGFIGISGETVEMLFIHPSARGKGLGKQLLHFAFSEYEVDKVDVNEQNEQAIPFYGKMGFEVVGRDALDGNGKPYPLLHMQLKTSTQ